MRHILVCNHLSPEGLKAARRRQAELQAAGRSADLLQVLAEFVSESTLSELTIVYERATCVNESPDAAPGSLPAVDGATRTERAQLVDPGRGSALHALGLSRRGAFCIAGGAVTILVALGLLWLGAWLSASREERAAARESGEIRKRLVTLLASPAGSPLPDSGKLLAQVTSLRGSAEMPLLRALLQSPEPQPTVRLNAATLLGLIGDATAGEALAEVAKSSDELERVVGLDCLGRLRGSRPLAVLVQGLASTRSDVRHYSIRALQEVGSARALESLVRLVDHPDPKTRVAATRAVLVLEPGRLPSLGRGGGISLPRQNPQNAIADAGASSVAPPVISADETPGLKPLASIASARLDSALESASLTPELRKASITEPPSPASAPNAEPTAAPTPSPAAESPTKLSKPPAKISKPPAKISKPPAKISKPPAPAKPPSPAEVAKRETPRLLELAKYDEALSMVERAMKRVSEDDAALFRLRGLAHLGRGAPDEALADFRRAIDLAPDMADVYFRMALCHGAKKDRRGAYTALTMALRLGFRDVVAVRNDDRLKLLRGTDAFRRLMDHYFHSPLAAERDDANRLRFASKRLQAAFQREKDPFLRALAVTRFPEAGGLEATELLFRYLKDRSFVVRRAIAEVLGRTRVPESVSFLARQVTSSRTRVEQRTALMWALDDIDGPEALNALLAGLEDEALAVQVAAARALGERPDRRAVEPLIRLLEKAKPLDRLTVAEALGKITGKDLKLEAADWRNWWKVHGSRTEIGPVRNPCQSSSAARTVVIPPAFSERSGIAKKRALARHGGSRQTELAVEKALEWLARHQNSDGRWDTDEWALCCDERKPWERVTRVRKRAWDTQVTGLALMAFLGAGNTHLAGKYSDTVRRGLQFLRKRQRGDGYFSGDHYHGLRSHEIATIAVTEAYLMTRDCELRPLVDRALRWILRRQHANGGWGWHARESYTSLTGWNLMALMTASQAGVRVPVTSLVSLRDFLDRVTVPENGPARKAGFAFGTLRPAAQVGESLSVEEHEEVRGGGSVLSTTVGLWCRIFLGQSPRDPRVLGALEQLKRPPKLDRDGKIALNEWLFFATQAALLQGGTTWKDWNRGMKAALLGAIVKDGCERGSWPPSSDHGRVYATALGTLLLESYYRFHAQPAK